MHSNLVDTLRRKKHSRKDVENSQSRCPSQPNRTTDNVQYSRGVWKTESQNMSLTQEIYSHETNDGRGQQVYGIRCNKKLSSESTTSLTVRDQHRLNDFQRNGFPRWAIYH